MQFSKNLVIFHSTCIYLGFILSIPFIYGQSEVEVKLITTGDFIEKGSNIILQCKHNVDSKVLYKVAWLKNCADIGKFFEFIVDRIPPFRNFTIPGAEIDWSNTNNEQIALKNIDFEFSGLYYCEVTTSTPIYTKASQDKRIRVILSQAAPPKISFSKRIYHVGEKLQANCTTSKAHPMPSITWLINGKRVDDKYVRQLHPSTNSAKNSHRSKSHQQQKHQQQQKEHNNIISTNSLDNKKIPKNMTRIKKNKHVHHQQNVRHDHNFEYNNYYNHHQQNNHRINRMINDNNYLDTNRKVNLFNHKYRRHVDEDNFPDNISYNNNNSYDNNNNNNGSFDKNEFNNITSTSSYITTTTTTINVSLSTSTTSFSSDSFSNTTKQYNNIHRGNISISQINIEISELYIGEKDKLEITCLATIPAHINDGEQFVDYKTYSVKVNVAKDEQSSSISSMSGITAYGNSSISTSVHKNSILLSAITFIILKF